MRTFLIVLSIALELATLYCCIMMLVAQHKGKMAQAEIDARVERRKAKQEISQDV
jgi:hypothetical protein